MSAGPEAPKPASYYAGANPGLLAVLPPGLDEVVEFGCGSGDLGAAYKQRNPATVWRGVEFEPAAALLARQKLDHVTVADANLPLEDTLLEVGSHQALVYGDVIEHLIDPWQCLRRHLELLRPDGLIAASIPNIQHWSAIVGLLRGEWRYRQQGLFDRTHLRFFTLDGIHELFRGLGLTIRRVEGMAPREGSPIVDYWDAYPRIIEDLRSLSTRLGTAQEPSRFQTLQYVVLAQRDPGVGSVEVAPEPPPAGFFG